MPIVIPAQAGIQEATAGLHLGTLDSRLRGNDGEQLAVNVYERRMNSRVSEITRRAAFKELVASHRFAEPVYITRPTLPPLEDYTRLLEGVWTRRWLTNDGELHQQLERALGEYLGVEHLSLFCNGTIGLLVALQALGIDSGEVITTPFTFPATPHVLHWNRVQPVFCDIDARTYNLDPDKLEACIGPNTKAILAVHVYGTPCDIEGIQSVADRHGLHVIYDAAHAFGVRYRGRSIVAYGDMSVLSFHATKLYSTGEGGALIAGSAAERERVNSLKNFGISGEETVIGPGINGKMNEFQAALGLLALDGVEEEIARRRTLAQVYREKLEEVPGITLPGDLAEVRHNYAYFPVLIDPGQYGAGRDELYSLLKHFNVFARKYFFPLCSHYDCYAGLPSAAPEHLPVAERVAQQVLCLPIYGTLTNESVARICDVVVRLSEHASRQG